MRNKTSFKSAKEATRIKKVVDVISGRTAHTLGIDDEEDQAHAQQNDAIFHNVNDHSYASIDLDHVVREEVVMCDEEVYTEHTEIIPSDSWREGRHVVELGVLADALQACTQCSLPLSLSSTIGEHQFGLGGFLLVVCDNPACSLVNRVPLGKRRKAGSKIRAWDINSKAAIGNIVFSYC